MSSTTASNLAPLEAFRATGGAAPAEVADHLLQEHQAAEPA